MGTRKNGARTGPMEKKHDEKGNRCRHQEMRAGAGARTEFYRADKEDFVEPVVESVQDETALRQLRNGDTGMWHEASVWRAHFARCAVSGLGKGGAQAKTSADDVRVHAGEPAQRQAAVQPVQRLAACTQDNARVY